MLTYQIQGGDIDAAAAQQRLVLKGRESMTMQQLPRAMKTIGDLDVAASLRVHAPTHNLVICSRSTAQMMLRRTVEKCVV